MSNTIPLNLFHLTMQVINIYLYLNYFFKTRIGTIKKTLSFCIAYMFFRMLLKTYLEVPIMLILYDIAGFIVISCRYKSTFIKRFYYAMFMVTMFTLTQSLVALMVPYQSSSLLYVTMESSPAVAIYSEIINFLIITVLLIIKKANKVPDMDLVVRSALIYVPVTSIFIVSTIYDVKEISSEIKIIILILILELNFLVFYFFNNMTMYFQNRHKSKEWRQQSASYEHELEIMQANFKNMRIMKHDIKNHMTVLYGLLSSGKNEECLQYMKKIDESLCSEHQLANSQNITVDSIINFKLYELEQSDAKLSVNLQISESLPISSFDISTILGNLLDNAITGVKTSSTKPYLSISIRQMKGMLNIIIKNSFNGVNKEENGKLLSSKREFCEPGTGMESIQNVVDKYNGLFSYEAAGNMFTAKAMIYLYKSLD